MNSHRPYTVSYYKRGKTWTYHLAWREGGRRIQEKRGRHPTKGAAILAADKRIKELETLGWSRPYDGTVRAWLETWLDSLVVAGRAATTVKSYRQKFEHYVYDRIGSVLLTELDTITIDKLYAELLACGGRDGRPLSARSVRYTHTILRRALADAKRKRLIPVNVADDATPPSSSAAQPPEPTVWSAEQMDEFLHATSSSYYGPMWHFMALTGVRRSEACGLLWRRVDLDVGTVMIRDTLCQFEGELIVGDGKTSRSRRAIDLDRRTILVLRRWRAVQAQHRLVAGEGWQDSGAVFTRPDGRAMLPDSVSQAFRRDVRLSGLPPIRLHDLRHTHGSIWAAHRHDAREVADRLGHSDPAFTLRTYVHLLPGRQRQGAEEVARLVFGEGC
jgi:integrase